MRITNAYIPIIMVAFLQSACSTAQSEPTSAPIPEPIETAQITPVQPPIPPAPKQPKGEWVDWSLAEGNWVYRKDSRGSLALFGVPQTDATFIIRCYGDTRKIFLSQKGSYTSGSQMTLRASSGRKNFIARDTGGAVPYTAVSMEPGEYMLDRIAFSRGRFAVETTGLQSIAIPIWPEFIRVVEDCRS